MLILNGQVVNRGSHVILFYDATFHAVVNRVAAQGDHLSVVNEVSLGDTSLIEIRVGDIVVVSDSVGPVGYLSVDGEGKVIVLVGNVELSAPAPTPAPVSAVGSVGSNGSANVAQAPGTVANG